MDFSTVATFFLLVGLELVLGIDNVLLISILTGRLPEQARQKARLIGLGLALAIRIVLVLGAGYLTKLTAPVIWSMSWRDLILLVGGAFLLYKAVKEIHHAVEHEAAEELLPKKKTATFGSIIAQIVALDVVFSIDSVITAVGLTSELWVIESAVVVSFIIVLAFATKVASFVEKNPAIKVLALSFLICIGVTLFMEAFHHEVPKAYIYLPMGFALMVELLQMRQSRNREKVKKT